MGCYSVSEGERPWVYPMNRGGLLSLFLVPSLFSLLNGCQNGLKKVFWKRQRRMIKKYRVVFLGLIKNEEVFKENMSRLGVSSEKAELMIRKVPIVLKGGMTMGHAREYAEAVQNAGGRVKLEEHGYFREPERMNSPFYIRSFKHFIMCPQCGYKQIKGTACVRCGFLLGDDKNGEG